MARVSLQPWTSVQPRCKLDGVMPALMSRRRMLMRASLKFFLCLAIQVFVGPGLAAEAQEETPFALLIANSAYPSGGVNSRLPEENARLIANELRHAGFSAAEHENLGRSGMDKAIDAFIGRIVPGQAVLFFFSGYAIQAKGATYLIPVDADIWTEADVRAKGVSIEWIAAAMDKAGAKTKLIVLDASRRNPFERRFRALSVGIAPVVLPPGSLLIASADPGEVAPDAPGDDGASLFAGELAKEMRVRGPTVDEIFHRTRIGVARATNGVQRPYVVSTLTSDFHFGENSGEADFGKRVPRRGEAEATRQLTDAGVKIGLPPGKIAPGMVFRDCAFCPDLVAVTAGEFKMGSGDFENEGPVHLVKIAKPFAIGRTEVTFAQWDACAEDGGCPFRPDGDVQNRAVLPVSGVSWTDAKAYVDWLSRKLGHRYRLPSEAEWEYAARAGTTTPFWWGTEAQAGFANCRGCGGSGGQRVLPVASYPANAFGLHDTAGNVAEWVEDCWTQSYDLTEANASAGSGACKRRVLRGGSFDAGQRFARSASRFLYDAELRYYTNGFRVLRELP